MSTRVRNLLVASLALLHAGAAFVLLYSPWCMFTRLKMQINDYGTYTNFIWNTAHGRPFVYLMDASYLKTHLSFTLALLAPLFWIWDHPFLLTVVQWACGVAGSLLTARLAWRNGLPPVLTAMLGLFFLTYAFTQNVLLCDFHGVCVFFVLFPWFYSELSKQSLRASLPLALIAGLREEAAVLVVPMILWFAVTRRWRAGYILAALAIAYAILAMLVLYPTINGITLWERRGHLLDTELPGRTGLPGLLNRAITLAWFFLPVVPLLLRRSALPILVFPLAALAIAMPSASLWIQTLDKQYSAAPFTLLVLGLLETLRARRDENPPPKFYSRIALWLFGVTVAAHFGQGYLPVGNSGTRDLMLPASPYGLTAMHAARNIPKDGILLTTSELSGITANRRDLTLFDRSAHKWTGNVDVVFAGWTHLFDDEYGSNWISRLRSGEFGAIYFDWNYAILQRGAPRGFADDVILAHDAQARTIIFTQTARHRGDLAYTRTWQGTRHWHGRGNLGPAILSHGSTVQLEAGSWIAKFRMMSKPPKKSIRGNRGFLELYAKVDAPPFARAEVDPATAQRDELTWQEVPFTLDAPTTVEVRALSGDAELWLDRVLFVPAQQPP